jgi:uncharacterized spore protein YtfJ
MADEIKVDGGIYERADDLPDVSSVFGQPYEAKGKTLIPVATVHRASSGAMGSANRSSATPKAVIEVDEGRVRVVEIVDPLHIVLPALVVGAWHVYWILKTVRDWRTRR